MIFLLFLATATPDAPPERVAVLPMGAEQIALDTVNQLRALDSQMRDATAAQPNIELQAADDTMRQVQGARQVGVACSHDDNACLRKLAVLTDVDLVIAGVARFDEDATAIHLVLADRKGGRSEMDIVLPSGEAKARAQALAAAVGTALMAHNRAQKPAVAPEVKPAPPPKTRPKTRPKALAKTTMPPPPSTAPKAAAATPVDYPSVGVWVATGIGGGLCAASVGTGAAAWGLDASLAQIETRVAREPKLIAGQALLGATLVSGVLAVAALGTAATMAGIEAAYLE